MAKFSIMSCFSDAYYCPWAVGQQCHFAFESCLHRPCCRETHVIHKCWGLCCESSWSWSERHRAYQKGRSRVRIALRYYFLSSSLPHLTTKINNWSLVYFLTIINLKNLGEGGDQVYNAHINNKTWTQSKLLNVETIQLSYLQKNLPQELGWTVVSCNVS